MIEYLVSLNINVASKAELAVFPYASTLRALTSISSPLVTNTADSTSFTQRQNLAFLENQGLTSALRPMSEKKKLSCTNYIFSEENVSGASLQTSSPYIWVVVMVLLWWPNPQ